MFKEESICHPHGTNYLGGKIYQREVKGAKYWSFNPTQYVTQAWKNVEEQLLKRVARGDDRFNANITRADSDKPSLLKPTANALPGDYHPELDMSDELKPMDAAYYQSLIGVLRWIVELGRVDLALECSVMSSCLALPREDHLRKVLQIFGYLKAHSNTELVFDPHFPEWYGTREEQFPLQDWKGTPYFTGENSLKEEKPENAPKPRGFGMVMSAFCDSDHAGCKVTRRSRTGFLVYLQSGLVYWHSKKQAGVETSSFGSEFIAMKQCTEYVRGLRYKLAMMGIRCDECCYIFGDN